jgi:hypothetical protein
MKRKSQLRSPLSTLHNSFLYYCPILSDKVMHLKEQRQ